MARQTATLAEVLAGLRQVAPENLGEAWDAVGLQLGSEDQPVAGALLCIDLTEAVLAEALEAGVDLIVAYHPPIFKPLEALTDRSVKQRIVLAAARAGLAIYSPHTALDAAVGGVNDWFAQGLGQGTIRPIKPTPAHEADATDLEYKLVTFVPHESADQVRTALSDHGAGNIGQYSECSFGVSGEGTFRGSEASSPTVGQAGQFEREKELRMELVVDHVSVGAAVAALWQAHPYEEPPYDVYRLESVPKPTVGASTGQGRVIDLAQPIPFSTLVERVNQRLGLSRVSVGGLDDDAPVQRIGLCVGSGGSVLDEAENLDAMITGEMSHHRQLAAIGDGVGLILAGHTQTERPYLPAYRRRIVDQASNANAGSNVEWRISENDTPPVELSNRR